MRATILPASACAPPPASPAARAAGPNTLSDSRKQRSTRRRRLQSVTLVGWLALAACHDDPMSVDLNCDPPVQVLPTTATGEIAITHVNIIPMTGEAVQRDRTVLLDHGVIERIGSAATLAAPATATVIDGTCRFLMPGLADMHVHMVYTLEALLYVANGVTTVREMWGSTGHLAFRTRVESGEILGPRMFVSSPGIDGIVQWPRTILITDPAKADTNVALLKSAGYDFLKVYEHLSAPVFDAVAASARSRGIAFAGHAPFAAGVTRVLASGQLSIEHMAGAYLPEVRSAGNAQGGWDTSLDVSKMRQLAQRLVSAHMWSTPTLVTLRAMLTPAEEAAFQSRPEMRYLPQDLIFDWVGRGPWASGTARAATIANENQSTKAFFDAGVRMMVGTDGGFPYVLPGFAINEELEMLAAAGLTPAQVLQMATRNAAEFLGRTGEFGTVAEGLRADLLLLSANPLADVHNVKARSGVLVKGRWYSAPELTRQLDQLAASQSASRPRSISGERSIFR